MSVTAANQAITPPSYQSTPSPGTGDFVTGAVTLAVGRAYIAVAGQWGGGTSDPSPDFTLTDSLGTTWTMIANVGEPNSWSAGLAIFTAVIASAVSRTFTMSGGGSHYMACMHAIAVLATGQDPTTPIAGIGNFVTTTAGLKTIALGATPTPTDLVLEVVYVINGGSTVTNGGAGYTTLINSYNSDVPDLLFAQYRSGSTSTSVDCTISGPEKAMGIAFILKDTGAPPPVSAGVGARMVG